MSNIFPKEESTKSLIAHHWKYEFFCTIWNIKWFQFHHGCIQHSKIFPTSTHTPKSELKRRSYGPDKLEKKNQLLSRFGVATNLCRELCRELYLDKPVSRAMSRAVSRQRPIIGLCYPCMKTNVVFQMKKKRKSKKKKKRRKIKIKAVTLCLETRTWSVGYMAKSFKARCPKP